MTTTPFRRAAPAVAPPRTAIGFAGKRAGGLYGVKAVGSFVPRLTQKAFERYGFSAASLITDWPTIAGRELAAFTAPERLKWPRAIDRSEDDVAPANKGRPGATLLLRVEPARALDVQYAGRQIIERINAYFGYAAVAELRILQAPVAAQAAKAQPRTPLMPLTREVAGISDARLRDALGRLGAGVRAER